MSKRFFHFFECPLVVTAFVVLAAPELALAGGKPYAGDLGQAIATLAIFLGLMLVLGKFAWNPVINQLRRREEDIVRQIKDTETSQEKADELAREYQDCLDNIEEKSEQMLAEAKRDAAIESGSILEAAHSEAVRAAARSDEDISAAQAQARKNLQAETAGMAAEIAGRFLSEKLSTEDHGRLVAEAAEQIGKKVGDKS